MKRRLAVVVARAARAVRGLWPDHNPLRRSLDRAEAAVVGGLSVAFLAMAPLATTTAFHMADRIGTHTAREQRSWHRATAVLLVSAPATWGSKFAAPQPVSWVTPGGARTAKVTVPWGAKAGSTVPVWVDGSGRLTSLPLRPAQVRAQAMLAAGLAPVVLGMLLAGAGLAIHGVLGWRRMAAWDVDWRVTEPRWTSRR
jgi:hypothetical protein